MEKHEATQETLSGYSMKRKYVVTRPGRMKKTKDKKKRGREKESTNRIGNQT